MNNTNLYSQEAEVWILGAILADAEVMDELSELRPEHFYVSSHRKIFEKMKEIYESGNTIDVVTLYERLKLSGELEEIGGADYLNNLIVPTTEFAKSHAEIIVEKWLRREALRISRKIADAAQYGDFNYHDELISYVEREVASLSVHVKNGLRNISEDIGKIIEDTLDDGKQKEDHEFVRTGFRKLDEFSGGLQRGAMIVLAARPSAGKTAFTLNIAANVSLQNVGPVLYFSQEMNERQMKRRILSSISGVSLKKILRKRVTPIEFEQLIKKAPIVEKMDLLLDDTPHVSVEYIASAAKKLKRERGKIGLIIIDYLGLLNIQEQKGETRANAIGRTTRRIKQLAKEMDCPIILIAQMNRAIEQRNSKRPQLSDLRESGDIEADADIVMFLHPDLDKSTIDEYRNVTTHVDLIIAKGRDIGIADFSYKFYGWIQRFEEI